MNLYTKLGFTNKKNWIAFLMVITSGQIIYSTFEAFKASFYTPLLTMLNISNAQFGILFSLLGIATFFYVPAGWLNNRFSPRKLLIWGLVIRIVGTIIMLIPNISFFMLAAIAILWGLVDSFFWPAVLNGTRLFASEKNIGIAFGLLESVRRALELGMNTIALLLFSTILSGNVHAMRIIIVLYTIIIALWILFIFKYVPEIKTLHAEDSKEKNKEALKGLLRALAYPEVWFAGLIGMAVYSCYISVVYSVPYMENIFGLSTSQAALFGLFNASGIGIIGGLAAGFFSDKLFKSPTRMLQYSLGTILLVLIVILILPKTPNMLIINIVLLFTYSFVIFLSRAVFFAPIGEVNIPKEISGAAMSISSFLTYSPIFWLYSVNGFILDKYPNEPITAYKHIFMISTVFAVLGFFAALILMRIINHRKAKQNHTQHNTN